jgi:hypothetical protein
MPIYEFFCPDNGKIYSFFARSLSMAGQTPRCPDGAHLRMERMISRFAVTGRAKEPSEADAGGLGDIDDARLEAAMGEMEREFSSAGDAEPDPKQIARMMKKMCDLTGEKMPAPMQEMIARMEKGEDPERLEEEYGDLMDGLDAAGDGGGPGDEGGAKGAKSAKRTPPVRRDPTLYEMSDYVG